MFYGCKSLISLPDLSNWNMKNVGKIDYSRKMEKFGKFWKNLEILEKFGEIGKNLEKLIILYI